MREMNEVFIEMGFSFEIIELLETSPAVLLMSPVSTLMAVVFPAPLCPRRQKILPS